MDFYDKLFVCTLLIVLSIFSVFSTFCFADTSVDVIFTDNLGSNSSTHTLVESDRQGFYFLLTPGHTYNVSFSFNALNTIRGLVLDSVPSVGASYVEDFILNPVIDTSYSFTYTASDSFSYFIVCSSKYTSFSDISVIDVTPLIGISGVVDSLVSTLNTELLWSSFKNVVPFVFITVVVVLGFYLLFKLIRGISKFKYRG